MGYVKLPSGLYVPSMPDMNVAMTYLTTGLIDATGEKVALIGQVTWNDGAASKDITKVGIRFGTVVKAGGSGLTLSLQDVTLTAGGPMTPDETQDQTYAIANGNSSFASNTYLHSGALSANRTANYGDFVAVVLEFDGSGRLGADSVIVSGIYPSQSTSQSGNTYGFQLKTGGSWSALLMVPNVIFEFTDGTFGTFENTLPTSAISSFTFNSGSSPDEYAIVWQLPFGGKLDGGWFACSYNTTGDVDFVLYDSDGTTALATRSIDGNTGAGAARFTPFLFSGEYAFKPNTAYYLAIRPATATNITVYYHDIANASYFGALFGGTNWYLASRTNAGAWTNLTTRRLHGGLRLSSVAVGDRRRIAGGFVL